jgi:hypothetical protein
VFSIMLARSLSGLAGSVDSLEIFISSIQTLIQVWLANSRMDVRVRMPTRKLPILDLGISPTDGRNGAKM